MRRRDCKTARLQDRKTMYYERELIQIVDAGEETRKVLLTKIHDIYL